MLSIGQKVKDQISGFEGVIVAENRYPNGTFHYVVRRDLGETKTDRVFGESQLEVMETAGEIEKPVAKATEIAKTKKAGKKKNPTKL
ncbi:MAG: hypothetical protein ACXWQE_00180 [Bdellovibrionales bacterium]